jgi:DNA invertase Pin-like site-specific DNA recombinase
MSDSDEESVSEEESVSIEDIQNNLNKINIKNQYQESCKSNDKSRKNKNKSLIYIRSSSKSQNDEMNNKNSYDNQLSSNMKYLKKNKLNIINIAFQTKRAFNIEKHLDYYNTLKSGEYNHLIVTEPSRLARTYKEGIQILKICDENNITIHCTFDKITSSSKSGRSKIIKGFKNAQTESNLVSKRIKNSVKQRKKFGSKIGIPRYGYQIKTTIDNSIGYPVKNEVPSKNEQKKISLIQMLYFGSNMMPINTIFRELLNDENYYLTYYDNKQNKLKKYSKILFGYLSKKDIADILNRVGLFRRGKFWSSNSINNIIKYIKNKYLTKKMAMTYHQKDGLAYHFYHNDHLSKDDKKRFYLKKFKDFPELKKIYKDGDDYKTDYENQYENESEEEVEIDSIEEMETQSEDEFESEF